MKKIITFVCAVVMALSMQAAAIDTIQVDGINYQLNDNNTATVIPAQSPATKYEIDTIVIPVNVAKDETNYPVVELAKQAFRNCTATSITFAKGSKVTELGMQVFQGAVNLETLELPEGIKTIPMTGIHNAAAANPMKMKNLILPASVDSIVRMSICLPQLEVLRFKGAIPPKINTFTTGSGYVQNPWEVNKDNACNTAKTAIVIVPAGSVEAYRNTPWIGDYFTTILAEKDTLLAEGLYYELNNLTHTATLIPAQNETGKYEQQSVLVPAVVTKGDAVYPVVALAKAAFRFSTVASIVFEENSNVREIGMQAFQRAINLKELELPEGIKLIPVTAIHSDQDPAKEAMSLEELVLPASVDSLAMMSIVASSLKSIEFKGVVPPGCCHKYIAASDYYQMPWIINNVHKHFTSQECMIIVPDGTLSIYQTAPGIGDYFTNIIEKKDVPTALSFSVSKESTVKVIREGQLFIIRGDKMYNVAGQEVR